MYVIVDDRPNLVGDLAKAFKREGVCVAHIEARDFADWIRLLPESELQAIEAFLVGANEQRIQLPKLIRGCADTPILCLHVDASLLQTVALLGAGADDVLGPLVPPREIVARVSAINRRARKGSMAEVAIGRMKIHFDGRPPEIGGELLELTRREQRILEYLARNRRRFVTKAQIFNAIYGLFDHSTDERVVESHICKLRKKLTARLGYDPIQTRRYLGYVLDMDDGSVARKVDANVYRCGHLPEAVCV